MKRQALLITLLLPFIAGCALLWPFQTLDADPELDRLIGQSLLIGFRGTELAPGHHLLRDIKQYHLGGVILYEYGVAGETGTRNIASPAQVAALTASIQRAAREAGALPLLIAIDEEGGRISRLKECYGFPPTVSAQRLGELDDPDTTAYRAGRLAATLAAAGINLNLAPVVDVNIDSQSPAIGARERSFSADPARVIRHARQYIDAHHRHHVLTCLKHFPGHGSARDDSHLGVTDITRTWQAVELEPYRALIASGVVDAIMSAHVYHRELDPLVPATLSPRVVGGMLRRDLGWQGVVISDCLQMGAVNREYGRSETVARALSAGVDILLFSNNGTDYEPDIVPETIRLIRHLVNDGRISRAQLTESARRIAMLKGKM